MQQEQSTHNLVPVVEAIATAWNRTGINYAVVHGLGDYPSHLGRDLDILMQRNQIQTALDVAGKIFQLHGFAVAVPSPVWGKRIVAIKNAAWDSAIELHTMSQLSWGSVLFCERPTLAGQKGPFRLDPWASFVKRVLIPLLAGGIDRFRSKPQYLTFEDGEQGVVLEQITRLCGNETAHTIEAIVNNHDLVLAARSLPQLRRSFVWSAVRKAPVTSVFLAAQKLRLKVIKPFVPCSPIVALVGPDGAGKSTVIQALADGPRSVFTDVVVRHWRPGLLPRLGAFAGTPESQPGADGLLPPRRNAGRFQVVRLLYYLVDFVIGHIVKDRVASSLQKLVLYDRCALDMRVDPLRYGLSSGRGPWWLTRLTPKPDLVILLHDQPERIHHRKPELTVAEIDRQLQEWSQMLEGAEVDAAIHVNAPPEKIAEEIRELITEAFLHKNHRLMTWATEVEDHKHLRQVFGGLGGGRTGEEC